MDIKVIMVPFGGDDSKIGAIRTSFALAKVHSAHVTVFRETILGGMTNFMIKNATIPVFMAH